MKLWHAALLWMLCLSLALLGCGAQKTLDPIDPAADYAGNVMLYTSLQEQQVLALQRGFEKKYPRVTMDYYFAGTGRVLTTLATEQQAGRVLADLLWVGDPADYVRLKTEGALTPYISPQGIHIDDAFVDEQHYYTGARIVNVGIAYNTDLVQPEQLPRDWTDLLKPEWQGRVVMTDPGIGGTSAFFVGAMMQNEQYGSAFFRALRQNGCALESSTNATHRQVALGNYAVGICLDYVTNSMAAQGAPLAFLYPRRDVVSVCSPLGLVAGGPNERNGKLLYDYILSPEGQALLVQSLLMSVRQDVEQPGNISLEAVAQRSMAVDLQAVAQNAARTLAAFDEAFEG